MYAGPKSPLYERESIRFDELQELKLIRGMRDYFSMEHHLSQVSLDAIHTEKLNYVMYSNSDHVTINLLMNTDVCSLGINFLYPQYREYPIRALPIRDCEPFLVIGYIHPEHQELSPEGRWFVQELKKIL